MDKDQVKEILESIKASADEKFETKAEVETKIETKADKAELEAVKEAIEAVTAKFDSIPAIVNKNEERSLELKSVNEAFVKSFEEKGEYSADIEVKAITQTAPVTGSVKPVLGLSGDLFAANPVRMLARKIDITGSTVTLPRKTGSYNAAVANATNKGTKASGDSAVAEVVITARTVNAAQDVTTESQEDIVGLDQFYAEDILAEIAAKEAMEHVVAVEAITNGVTTAANTGVTFADLNTLIHSVPVQYRQNGVLMLSTDAMAAIRELDEAGTGSKLIFDPIEAVDRFMGFRVVENGYMADMTAGNVIGAFGNWGRGLVLANRKTATLTRSNVTKLGHISYYGEMRSGIGEVDTNALRKLTVKA
ncbi:phage major capsid protein [Tritonibacter mobilis]|uniref:Phage capsid-like C-terminal domain-containing protein n=1 Tax=Tritonibacter mobilis F1926 TaxID=1265309 RepID=A0A1B1A6M8_9RHOB|nr:phage major capsid protein [Tritonibacter mobilis]ANP42178.1 hypothetical protein K529_015470 [Tritonibacter mobilis F1926]KJZ22280.1 hypothetical protein TW79_18810 [Tritonibacter mobilis]